MPGWQQAELLIAERGQTGLSNEGWWKRRRAGGAKQQPQQAKRGGGRGCEFGLSGKVGWSCRSDKVGKGRMGEKKGGGVWRRVEGVVEGW